MKYYFLGIHTAFCLWHYRIGCYELVISSPASCAPVSALGNDSQGFNGTVLQPPMSVPEVFSSNWNSESAFKY